MGFGSGGALSVAQETRKGGPVMARGASSLCFPRLPSPRILGRGPVRLGGSRLPKPARAASEAREEPMPFSANRQARQVSDDGKSGYWE
ncbi:hypothetical protein N2W54_002953 [Lotmaria passim]